VLRVIMLNNNIKILLVSFVHHIELQNFLNAPRSFYRHCTKFLRGKLATRDLVINNTNYSAKLSVRRSVCL